MAEAKATRKKQSPQLKYMSAMDRMMSDLDEKGLRFVFNYLVSQDEYCKRLKGLVNDNLLK